MKQSKALSSVVVSRILHAGYIFEHAGVRIAFDPIFENPFSKNCYAFPPVRFNLEGVRQERFAAVFISHFHDDHCSLESLNLLDRATPIYLFCVHDELFDIIRSLGFAAVHSLQLDAAVTVGGFEITPRRALDADVDSIFHLQVAGLNILNVVDSWIDDEVLASLVARGPWDLIMWPFQTMREVEVIAPRFAEASSRQLPPEWLEQIRKLLPKQIIPSSCQFLQEEWSWYNQAFFPISYEIFKSEMARIVPSTGVVRLNPGCSIDLSFEGVETAARVSWIEPMGAEDVDYRYDPDLRVPTTREIARRFTDIGSERAALIYSYCESGLLERYRELGSPDGRYFRKKRVWRLSVYDSLGEARVFHYRLDEDDIELCGDVEEEAEEKAEEKVEAEWTTEIPLEKFYAALIDGETLTSLYLRVNDGPFSASVDLRDVEIIDDPLVRCLYNGVFGAYQRAQLARLRSPE